MNSEQCEYERDVNCMEMDDFKVNVAEKARNR